MGREEGKREKRARKGDRDGLSDSLHRGICAWFIRVLIRGRGEKKIGI
jgi:hypothetical protein